VPSLRKSSHRSRRPSDLVRFASFATAFAALLLAGRAEAQPRFPLAPSTDGHYVVDAAGTPFRVQGDASWDAHLNLTLADLRVYLNDRKARGINALFTYVSNPVAYFAGSSAPWAVQLGGRSAGTAALPFTLNAAGGAWDGDPTFAHHDASFASPNDAYFAWVAQFVDEAASRGMAVLLAPMYLGFGQGALDGWYQTLANTANTQSVCFAFGKYLATGHGAFTGFKSRSNVIWVDGGDMIPTNGSEGALRALQVLEGLQAGGATQIHTAHWVHDVLTPDQTDFAPHLSANAAYTHGSYPSLGPTYAEARALYATTPSRPEWLIETTYWGEHGASRAQLREFHWGAALSTIGGVVMGFGPFWGFAVSADGTSSTSITTTTAWQSSTGYALDQYVSRKGNWYRAVKGGQSGTTGPSGTASSIADGSVTWTFVATGDWRVLLGESAVVDFQRMGAFLNGIAWYHLVPSGLAGMATLVTTGTGTPTQWSDDTFESGGEDWIVSAAARDGTLLLAYVPSTHQGAFTVAMSVMRASARARWLDPTSGAFAADPAGSGFVLANKGTHSFATPGLNATGDADWVLVLDTASAAPAPAFPGGAVAASAFGALLLAAGLRALRRPDAGRRVRTPRMHSSGLRP
jgi:hypothetical protein